MCEYAQGRWRKEKASFRVLGSQYTFTKYHCEHATNMCLPGDYYVVMHVNYIQGRMLNLFAPLDPQGDAKKFTFRNNTWAT